MSDSTKPGPATRDHQFAGIANWKVALAEAHAERDRYRLALERLDQYVPPGWRQATIDIALGRVPTEPVLPLASENE